MFVTIHKILYIFVLIDILVDILCNKLKLLVTYCHYYIIYRSFLILQFVRDCKLIYQCNFHYKKLIITKLVNDK